MSARERKEFWAAIPDDARGSRIFGLLAGDDLDWIRNMLHDGQVEAKTVLDALGNDDKISLADLANLVASFGVDPLHVATTIEYGTRWGEDHERLAAHLEQLRDLADSPDPDVRRVGLAGVAHYQTQYEDAARQAHRDEVTGHW